jgi:serine/threonine-protein kinase
VPADLEAIVLRCLSKSPDERYAGVTELEQALAQCRDAGKWNDRAAAEWWRDFGESPAASTPTETPDAFAVTTVATPAMAAS